MGKAKIYLAGPISGCNEEQRHVWRNDLKRGFGEEFDFIDPTDRLIGRDGADSEVVQADIDAIRSADAVLANLWRESIGTAFGIVHASSAGKPVVVCDSNFLQSRMVAFYADAVLRTLPEALHAIRTFLRVESQVLAVRKRNGAEEPFDRAKLNSSVRKACLAAGQSDLFPARAATAKTLEILLSSGEEGRHLTVEQIREAVWQATAELAADPTHQTDFDAIRQAWSRYSKQSRPPKAERVVPSTGAPQVHAKPLDVPVRTNGTHGTIWGNKIVSRAMPIFDAIRCVSGIVEVVLGPFSNTHSPPAKPHTRLVASKTVNVIEGRLFDKGPRGTLQTFQIRVANPADRDAILATLREHLGALGHIRSVVFSAEDGGIPPN